MQLTHRFRLPVPVEEVYEAFNHLERLAPCFPGATLTSSGTDQVSGTVALKLGAVPLHYRGTGVYLERSASHRRVVVRARGEDTRGLGSAVALVTTQLTGHGGTTDVEISVELDLTGAPARYGSAVVSETSGRLFEQFSSCLGEQLGHETTATGARHPSRPHSQPGSAEVAVPAPEPVPPQAQVDPASPPAIRPAGPRRMAVSEPASLRLLATLQRHGPVLAVAAALGWLGVRLLRRLGLDPRR